MTFLQGLRGGRTLDLARRNRHSSRGASMKKPLLLLFLAVICSAIDLRAQDARAVLDAAAAALGAANLRSLQFSGGAPTTSSARRTTAIRRGRASASRASRWRSTTRRRPCATIAGAQQLENPPLGGGFQPLIGELRQIWVAQRRTTPGTSSATTPCPPAPERDMRTAVEGRLTQIWLTPHGFIKAAHGRQRDGRATETVRGAKKTSSSFTRPNKVRFEGMLERSEPRRADRDVVRQSGARRHDARSRRSATTRTSAA